MLFTSGPHPGPGFGAVVRYKIPALAGLPSTFMAWLGHAGQVPISLLQICLCAWAVSFLYLCVSMQCLCMGEQHTHLCLQAMCVIGVRVPHVCVSFNDIVCVWHIHPATSCIHVTYMGARV